MGSQKEEAAMSKEIVKGGPGRKAVHRPKLGIADKIALGLTGLGVVSLAGTAIEAQKQSPPPQVTPDQRGSVPPPEGITFPEGVRADAPAEPVLSHKLFLPNIVNRAPDNLVLTAEQRLERFIETTQVVDRVEERRNNKTYSVETRVAPDVPLKITVKPELKNEVAKLVAQDGEKNGFIKAEIVVAQPITEAPRAGDEIAPGVAVRYAKDVWDYNTQSYITVGYFAVQQRNNSLTFFFAPANNLPLDNPEFMQRANRSIANSFFRMTASGGDPIANVFVQNPGHGELVNKTPFFLVS